MSNDNPTEGSTLYEELRAKAEQLAADIQREAAQARLDVPDIEALLGDSDLVSTPEHVNPALSIFERWEVDGELTALEAIRELVPHLRKAEQVLAEAQKQVDEIKEFIRYIAQASGESRITFPDLDLEVAWRDPYPRITVNAGIAQQVVEDLRALGEQVLAEKLSGAIKQTPVSGGYSVGRVRK